ncbi:molybdopterin converting factor subunit 1 [Thalassobacillus pellis]|uniref:molybdopterin converting factor subunit 1 n=1 Tax=Thalassobacillus pellis TaxID=748008 RepID=UPI001961F71F|nr:molybdopterin converting factor subunit 1 [Thalassobacillus pellis]MBM7554057.1 molybdopterin synthase sulfur carrier subunit [Thalassobacillus pellis]
MTKILLFAGLQEKTGEEAIELDFSKGSVKDLREQLLQEYQLEDFKTAMVAINEEFAANDRLIEQGDIVAFIPPVSGG